MHWQIRRSWCDLGNSNSQKHWQRRMEAEPMIVCSFLQSSKHWKQHSLFILAPRLLFNLCHKPKSRSKRGVGCVAFFWRHLRAFHITREKPSFCWFADSGKHKTLLFGQSPGRSPESQSCMAKEGAGAGEGDLLYGCEMR